MSLRIEGEKTRRCVRPRGAYRWPAPSSCTTKHGRTLAYFAIAVHPVVVIRVWTQRPVKISLLVTVSAAASPTFHKAAIRTRPSTPFNSIRRFSSRDLGSFTPPNTNKPNSYQFFAVFFTVKSFSEKPPPKKVFRACGEVRRRVCAEASRRRGTETNKQKCIFIIK